MRKKLLLSSLLLLFCVLQTMAQQRTITGTVTSKEGTPLVDASVTVIGQRTGVRTGTDGTFSINVPSNAKQLQISYVGSETQRVDITSSSNVSVSLVNSSQALTDVVVIGYGSARKRDLTGAVASIQAKDFNKGVLASPDQLLTGKVAGLEVSVNSGQPGAATTVKIRGNNSIRGGTTPLYVVDGIPLDGRSPRPSLGSVSGLGDLPDVNPLIYLNPNDIASFEVLKDASSSAIYGSRGANGVILITTKKGQAGGMRVDFSASVGTSGLMKTSDVLSASQYRSELKVYNAGSDSGLSLNPFKEITRHAITQNYNVSLSGGNETGSYRASFLASDQQGIILKSGLKKYLATFSGQHRFINNKLSINFNLTASNYTEQIAPISTDAGSTGNLISAAMNWNPTLALVRSGGSFNQTNPSGQINPLALSAYSDDNNNVSTLLGSISAAYKILPNLEYQLLYGANYGTGIRKFQLQGLIAATGGNADGKGEAILAGAQLFSQTITHTLTYNANLTQSLKMNLVGGYEYWTTSYKNQSTSVYGFNWNVPGGQSLSFPYYNNIQSGNQANLRAYSYVDPSVELQSYFARGSFNLQDKYLLTATFRADGSSRFGKNNKYAYFPSVAAKWVISEESFMKNKNTLSNLALRLGYGQTGSQDGIPAGASQQIGLNTGYNSTPGGSAPFSIVNYSSPNLKWETVTSIDGGIDFGFLGNRIFGYIDAFSKKTTNVLFLSTLPVPSNGASIWKNLPNGAYVTNKGFEFSLGAAIVRNANFVWNLNVNVEYVKNTFIYPAIGASPLYLTGSITGQGVSSAFAEAIANGQPIDVFYLRQFEGFDKNGIALIKSQASTYVGDPNPHVILGVSTDLTHKKWSLSINTHGAFGNKIYNNTLTSVTNLGNIANGKNISKTLIGSSESLANPVSASTRFLQSGNYMKLGNATISYNIGAMGKVVRNSMVFLTGSNLFEITKYTGFDAEVSTDHNNNGVPSLGIDYIGYPTARTITFGINFGL
ncbi:MAG: SusC/RagA family TonB-linked outer membrane protein [Bacteroidota bacterium]|nr:SusC/RagA family TonB-linked outer membrane protein [Bacteroidota bacterium]